MRRAFGKAIVPVTSWVLGNIVWGLATFIYARVVGDTPMITAISMIGFLILIVTGFVTFIWLLFRNQSTAMNNIKYENMARYVTMMFFAQEYDVSPKVFGDLSSPQAMEERAKRLRAERELSDMKGPQEK